MGSIRARKETGHLFFDFTYRGVRCREQTTLPDTPGNRRMAETVLGKLEKSIKLGTFVYSEFFPTSPKAEKFDHSAAVAKRDHWEANCQDDHLTPLFKDFAQLWLSENEVEWKNSYRETMYCNFSLHLNPFFGDYRLSAISKEDILRFRKETSRKQGKRGKSFSTARINKLMGCLKTILEEGSSRYNFATPFQRIKRLREPRSRIEPFTLHEINSFITFVQKEFRDYYWTRFFSAMRTAEIDGLKWEYVDFNNRLILIRETLVNGRTETPKTDGSLRDIQMLGPVYEALKRQHTKTGTGEYVFTNLKGNPHEHRNITHRVWYPALEKAGLRKRNPYQTRHTAATLWLAAGENPEWIARQMGHSNTRMLFTVYSRYVPNLTRQDGSAFENLLSTQMNGECNNELLNKPP